MNLRKLKHHTMANFAAGNAVIWKGPPGFGKTDLALQLFSDLQKQNPTERWGLCVCFIATKQSVDAGGLPWKGERTFTDKSGKQHTFTVTDPAMPEWFISTEGMPAVCYDKVLLVLEEWGQGAAETKRAFAEILRVGGSPPFYLPSGSPRLALSNIDKADGVTKEFDFIIGRRVEFEVSGDAMVWLDDFANHEYVWSGRHWLTMPVTKAFAKQHPDILFEGKPKKQGPWCNPRSLTMWDRYAQVMANHNNGMVPHGDPEFMEASQGIIGMPAYTQLGGFLQYRLELPQYEAVIADPEGCDKPTQADKMLLMTYELAGRCQPDDLAPCITYIQRFPRDYAVTFVSAVVRRDYKTMINHPAMTAWVSKNAGLVSLLGSLSSR